MEPAEYQPDDDPKKLAGFFKVPPQWSQPRIGWVTWLNVELWGPIWPPQWSQPRIGWVTGPRGPAPISAGCRNGASRGSAG